MTQYGFTTFLDLSKDEELFHTVENKDLPNPFPNITERTGIESRQIVRESMNIVTLVRHAVKGIMSELDINGRDCSGIVISTSNRENQKSLDQLAEYIARENGIVNHRGLNVACSGFPASIEAAIEMGNEKKDKHILVITAEITSALVDWDDENTAVVFGDGLAATSIVPDGKHPIHHVSSVVDLDDPKECLRLIERKGTQTIYGQHIDEERSVISMGQYGGRHLYRTVPQRFLSLIEESPYPLSVINHIVSHQANGKFAERMKEILFADYPNIDIVNTIRDQANIVSASIPAALAKSIGTFTVGDMVACPAKGAGMNFKTGTLSEGLLVFEVGE
ncbi:hypothetical protein COU75_00715 [Candidatus Peregrinibacteria bacterium CG10_big_fil_rev_8_21_14_0_10_42_8]|nr:MAG: hypothetical protein COU75_00715 [Candidatus Peregrinibacteria bacterium CG10_big_fil_rev_8_21_14_0_10_42_8]